MTNHSPPQKPSRFYVWTVGLAGLVGGYLASAIAGAIFFPGPQGPLVILFTMFPVIVLTSIAVGRRMDRKAAAALAARDFDLIRKNS